MKPKRAIMFNILSAWRAWAGALLAYFFSKSVDGVPADPARDHRGRIHLHRRRRPHPEIHKEPTRREDGRQFGFSSSAAP